MTTLQSLAGLAVIVAFCIAVVAVIASALAQKCPRCGAQDISSINLCESRCNACACEWRRK